MYIGQQIPFAKDYFITKEGVITSIKNGKQKELKPHKEKSGYLVISLLNDGICIRKRVHQIVAITFLPNPENKPQVNHIDGNKSNNHLDNLEWCSAQHNIRHAFDTGLCIRPKGEESHMYGSKNKYSKKVKDINTGRVFNTISEAASYLGMPRTTLNAALTGTRPNYTNIRHIDYAYNIMPTHKCLIGSRGKIIFNKETGIYFGNITEAALAYNYRRSYLNSMLNGTRVNKSPFIYT